MVSITSDTTVTIAQNDSTNYELSNGATLTLEIVDPVFPNSVFYSGTISGDGNVTYTVKDVQSLKNAGGIVLGQEASLNMSYTGTTTFAMQGRAIAIDGSNVIPSTSCISLQATTLMLSYPIKCQGIKADNASVLFLTPLPQPAITMDIPEGNTVAFAGTIFFQMEPFINKTGQGIWDLAGATLHCCIPKFFKGSINTINFTGVNLSTDSSQCN